MSRISTAYRVLGVCLALSVASAATARADDKADIAAMRQEIAGLQAQVKTLEAKLDQANKQAPAPASTQLQPGSDPFAQMDAMERQMYSMMARPFEPVFGSSGGMAPIMRFSTSTFKPGYDLKETDKAYIVTFDMPGVDKSKINVEVRNGALYVSGERSENREDKGERLYRQERSFGYFSRVIPLPDDARPDSVQAKHENGVLTVTIARKENTAKPQPKTQKIEVQ